MALPSILRIRRRNRAEKAAESRAENPTESPADAPAGKGERVSTPSKEEKAAPAAVADDSDAAVQNITKADISRGTKLRRNFAISASVSYLFSFIFLVLVLIGNTYPRPVLSDIYFYKLDLADIIPTSVPNANLINSIAQTIGLHDFYQVGLWNFCEGYENVGITFCSHPENLYWFNPVEVLLSELLSGATIALPTQVITILDVLRISSKIMFGFFLTACVASFALIFISPLALRSRWWSLPLALVAFLVNVLVGAASIVGSVISIAFKYAATAQSDLNIHANIGVKMFVFMWLGAAFALLGFIIHAGMGCCCVSRRDLQTGRRRVRDGN